MSGLQIRVMTDTSHIGKVPTTAHKVCLCGPKGAVRRVLLTTTRVRHDTAADDFFRRVAARCASLIADEDLDKLALVLLAGDQ